MICDIQIFYNIFPIGNIQECTKEIKCILSADSTIYTCVTSVCVATLLGWKFCHEIGWVAQKFSDKKFLKFSEFTLISDLVYAKNIWHNTKW